MMHKTGLAIITKGLSEPNLQIIYEFAKNYVQGRLYLSVKGFGPFNGDWRHHINTCYSTANRICPELDIRLLMPSSDDVVQERDISVILCDSLDMKHEQLIPFVSLASTKVPSILFNVKGIGESLIEAPQPLLATARYSSVCLGGTFDRLHNGHKILLSLSALLTDQKLFCGVSSESMLANKCLLELIEPLETRIAACAAFLADVRCGPEYTVEAIESNAGPTIDRADLDCIVASKETEKGCQHINEQRRHKGLPPLAVELIDMVQEEPGASVKNLPSEILDGNGGDNKTSSTLIRLRLLGETLRPPLPVSRDSGAPYVIGLTGGTASGKTSIASRLKARGAHIIDCDQLGHQAYRQGTECYSKVVAEFGTHVIDASTGDIDRRQLGTAVFNDPTRMARLTGIVWPEIGRLALLAMSALPPHSVVVVDGAVLIDAGWHLQLPCNELWVTVVPRPEAVARLQARNGLSEDQARARVDSQRSNGAYVEAANVVLCTLWSYEFTDLQVAKAWDNVVARLPAIVTPLDPRL